MKRRAEPRESHVHPQRGGDDGLGPCVCLVDNEYGLTIRARPGIESQASVANRTTHRRGHRCLLARSPLSISLRMRLRLGPQCSRFDSRHVAQERLGIDLEELAAYIRRTRHQYPDGTSRTPETSSARGRSSEQHARGPIDASGRIDSGMSARFERCLEPPRAASRVPGHERHGTALSATTGRAIHLHLEGSAPSVSLNSSVSLLISHENEKAQTAMDSHQNSRWSEVRDRTAAITNAAAMTMPQAR
jgi:hypothetical protein